MSKVPLAVEQLHRAESALALELLRVSDWHRADHEIHHVARDLARWSCEHVAELARLGRRHGLDLAIDVDVPAPEQESLLGALRQKGDELLGRHHDASLVLLADLRALHRDAAGVSLDWEVLAQTAQALRDTELLDAAERCHPQTLRQMRWANAQLKEAAAQVMVTP